MRLPGRRRMKYFWIVWNWLRNFFGNVFLIFVIIGLVLVIIEAFANRRKGKASAQDLSKEGAFGKAPEEGTAENGSFEKRIAVVTGASSGMGAEFAEFVDRTEKDIDEIWLIARRRERLEKVAEGLQHQTKVLPMDLLDTGNFPALERKLQQEHAQVGLFINCAGYAKIGNYAAVSREESERLVDLNCRAAVDSTVTVLPFMRAGDRIIEICSTAAFQPLQHFNIYAAAKSFLYYYCRALRMELLPRKISVTAVCPYWVKDTEFISVARDGEKMKEGKSAIRNFAFSTTRARVVRRAMRSSRMGFAVSTPGIVCFFHRMFSKVIAKESLLYIWELVRRV